METTRIPLSQCVESSYQNRKELGDVSGLARSIEVNGQITPLIVVADGEAYQLVVGHRRTAAMRSLGLVEADAYVMDGWDDARIAQILNAENMLALPQNQPNAPLYPAGGAPGSRPGALPHFGRPRYLGPPPRARSTAG